MIVEAIGAGLWAAFWAKPLLWLLILGFAICAGACSSECFERRRGLVVVAWALASATCFALAAAVA